MPKKKDKQSEWSCPKCGRDFAKVNQSHSCLITPITDHFKSDYVRELYEFLLDQLRSHEIPFEVQSVKTCIHLTDGAAFLGIFFHKNHLILDFSSSEMIRSDRILKREDVGEGKYLHHLKVSEKSDIDTQLLYWLAQAHRLERGESE